MKGKRFWNSKGTAIIFAMIIMIIVSVVTTTAILFVTSQSKAAARNERQAKAHYLALAGLRWGQWYESEGNDLPDSEPAAPNMPVIDPTTNDWDIGVKVWEDLAASPVKIRSRAIY